MRFAEEAGLVRRDAVDELLPLVTVGSVLDEAQIVGEGLEPELPQAAL